jgi:hypothetical protein
MAISIGDLKNSLLLLFVRPSVFSSQSLFALQFKLNKPYLVLLDIIFLQEIMKKESIL